MVMGDKMGKTKRKLRTLAGILCISIFLQNLPMTVYADESAEMQVESQSVESEQQEVIVESEQESESIYVQETEQETESTYVQKTEQEIVTEIEETSTEADDQTEDETVYSEELLREEVVLRNVQDDGITAVAETVNVGAFQDVTLSFSDYRICLESGTFSYIGEGCTEETYLYLVQYDELGNKICTSFLTKFVPEVGAKTFDFSQYSTSWFYVTERAKQVRVEAVTGEDVIYTDFVERTSQPNITFSAGDLVVSATGFSFTVSYEGDVVQTKDDMQFSAVVSYYPVDDETGMISQTELLEFAVGETTKNIEITGLDEGVGYHASVYIYASLVDAINQKVHDVYEQKIDLGTFVATGETTYLLQEKFPDAVFRSLIVSQLQKIDSSVTESSEVTSQQLGQISTLYSYRRTASETAIYDLTGIELLTNLSRVVIRNHELDSVESVEWEKLSVLELLNLSGNNLSLMPDLSRNLKLNDIDFSNNIFSQEVLDTIGDKLPADFVVEEADTKFQRRYAFDMEVQEAYYMNATGLLLAYEVRGLKKQIFSDLLVCSYVDETLISVQEYEATDETTVYKADNIGLSEGIHSLKVELIGGTNVIDSVEKEIEVVDEDIFVGNLEMKYMEQNSSQVTVGVYAASYDCVLSEVQMVDDSGVIYAQNKSIQYTKVNDPRFAMVADDSKSVLLCEIALETNQSEIPEGNYHLSVRLEDGTTLLLEDRIVVLEAGQAVISDCYFIGHSLGNGYDNTGDYFYLVIEGKNLKPAKLEYKCKQSGVTLPISYVEYKEIVGGVIVKLLKGDGVSTSNGEIEVTITGKEGYTLQQSQYQENLDFFEAVYSVVYNSVTKQLEVGFAEGLNVVGESVIVELMTFDSSGMEQLEASATTIIDLNGMGYFSLEDTNGTAFVPMENYSCKFVIGENSYRYIWLYEVEDDVSNESCGLIKDTQGKVIGVELYDAGSLPAVIRIFKNNDTNMLTKFVAFNQRYYFTEEELAEFNLDELYDIAVVGIDKTTLANYSNIHLGHVVEMIEIDEMFSNDVLKAAIIKELEKQYVGMDLEAGIPVEFLYEIQELSLDRSSIYDDAISDLTGIEKLIGLKELSVRNHKIKTVNSIDWAKLSQLEVLDLSGNRIGEIPDLTQNSKLKNVSLAYNAISDTELKNADVKLPDEVELTNLDINSQVTGSIYAKMENKYYNYNGYTYVAFAILNERIQLLDDITVKAVIDGVTYECNEVATNDGVYYEVKDCVLSEGVHSLKVQLCSGVLVEEEASAEFSVSGQAFYFMKGLLCQNVYEAEKKMELYANTNADIKAIHVLDEFGNICISWKQSQTCEATNDARYYLFRDEEKKVYKTQFELAGIYKELSVGNYEIQVVLADDSTKIIEQPFQIIDAGSSMITDCAVAYESDSTGTVMYAYFESKNLVPTRLSYRFVSQNMKETMQSVSYAGEHTAVANGIIAKFKKNAWSDLFGTNVAKMPMSTYAGYTEVIIQDCCNYNLEHEDILYLQYNSTTRKFEVAISDYMQTASKSVSVEVYAVENGVRDSKIAQGTVGLSKGFGQYTLSTLSGSAFIPNGIYEFCFVADGKTYCKRTQIEARPNAITGLTMKYQDGKAQFTWNKVTNADAIYVYRSLDKDNWDEAPYAQVAVAQTTFEDSDFMENGIPKYGIYYYKIVPVILSEEGVCSANALLQSLEILPEPVKMKSVESVSESEIEVQWETYLGADSYQIYRREIASDMYQKIATITDPSKDYHVDTTVVTGKTYAYKVTAMCQGIETSLVYAKEMTGRTKPDQPNIVAREVQRIAILSNADFEYAIGTSITIPKNAIFMSGNDDELSFEQCNGTLLKDNTQYYMYVRTKSSITNETQVYSTPLAVKTKEIINAEIRTNTFTINKGETESFKIILLDDENGETEYTGIMTSWAAKNKSGKAYTMKKVGSVFTFLGSDKKEILSISGNGITAIGNSIDKTIVLTGTFKTVRGITKNVSIEITVSVPVVGMSVVPVKKNGVVINNIDTVYAGDTITLQVVLDPANADVPQMEWGVSNDIVASITTSADYPKEVEVNLLKAGSTTVEMTAELGRFHTSVPVEVGVKEVELIGAIPTEQEHLLVMWDAYVGAETYQIYRKALGDSTYTLIDTMTDTTATQYVDDTVIVGKTYYYKVVAVSNTVLSDLDKTIAKSARIIPGTIIIAENGVTETSITIKAVTSYEYAIGFPGDNQFTLAYVKPTSGTLTFNQLDPNTEYVIYVRTSNEVTGETSVYGPALQFGTLVKAELVLSAKKLVVSKGNRVPFTYSITPENIHYMHQITWTADNGSGIDYLVEELSGAEGVCVKDGNNREILRITNQNIYAIGESEYKEVYLHATKGSMTAMCHVLINVPVVSLSFEQNDELNQLKLGESSQLITNHLPSNADDTELLWKSSNEQVAVVENGIVTATGVGTCSISASTADGVSVSREINVVPIEEILGLWISEQLQFDVDSAVITENPETPRYEVAGLATIPQYVLNEAGATLDVAVYVLKDNNGLVLSKAEQEDIRFVSANEAVAVVTDNGVIEAVETGETDIIVFDKKGNDVFGYCHIQVGGQKSVQVKPIDYAIDKSIRLSAVTANFMIQAYALDPESYCTVRVQDQYKHVYASEAELKMFSFSSAKPEICMVDANGVVRSNPTYKGKDTTVRITATLKNDKGNRKVSFNVSLLTQPQIDKFEIIQNGDVVESVTQKYEKGYSNTFVVKAYDSRGQEISMPKMRVSLSDTSVASVKLNTKDNTVTVTWRKAGRTNLICTANDKMKLVKEITMASLDTKPYADKTQLTMNVKCESKVYDGNAYKISDSFCVTNANTSVITGMTICEIKNGRVAVEQQNYKLIQNADGSYAVAMLTDYVKKNMNLALTLDMMVTDDVIGISNVHETLSMKLRVVSTEPKITVKEDRRINRFYSSQNETLLIITSPTPIEKVEIQNDAKNLYDDYFEVKELYRGQWYLRLNNASGMYNRNSTNLKLVLTAEGYEPITKALSIQTPLKKQSIRQNLIPVIHYGNGQQTFAQVELYNQTIKKAMTDFEVVSFESAKLVQGAVNGGKLEVLIKNGVTIRNGETLSAKIVVKESDWSEAIKVDVKVRVNTKIPNIVVKPASLTLNTKVPFEKAKMVLSTDQNNVQVHDASSWSVEVYNSKTRVYEVVNWLDVSYEQDAGTVSLGIKEGETVVKGNYKARIQNVIAGFEDAKKEFTVRVIDSVPKITVSASGKLDLINRKTNSLAGTIRYANTISVKATAIEVRTEDNVGVNPFFKANLVSDNKFMLQLTEEGMSADLEKRKYSLPLKITLENGTILDSTYVFTTSQTNPRVKVPTVQTIYKSRENLTRDYDFVTGLVDGVVIQKIEIVSVPKGLNAISKNGHVLVTLNDRGIKLGNYAIKVNLYFEGATAGTRPISQTINVKVAE